jgi:hypothetical protein
VLGSVVEAGLKVMSPLKLAEAVDSSGRGMISASLGNFGHINYGESMLGQVIQPKTNQYGCNKFTQRDFD